MRTRAILGGFGLSLAAAVVVVVAAEPTTRPAATAAAKAPTTRFASVTDLLKAAPANLPLPALKPDMTNLQADAADRQVKAVNAWYSANAEGRPVRVVGTVADVYAVPGDAITVQVTADGDQRVDCQFPTEAESQLLHVNRGDRVMLDGAVGNVTRTRQAPMGDSGVIVTTVSVTGCRLADGR